MYNRIATWRADKGVSRRDLAQHVGVHVQTIGFIERGTYTPGLELGMVIAAYFGVRVESIFSLTPFGALSQEREYSILGKGEQNVPGRDL